MLVLLSFSTSVECEPEAESEKKCVPRGAGCAQMQFGSGNTHK